MSDTTRPTCPDTGTCHHACLTGDDGTPLPCFRVRHCGPLSAYGDTWPADLVAKHEAAHEERELLAGPWLYDVAKVEPNTPFLRWKPWCNTATCDHPLHALGFKQAMRHLLPNPRTDVRAADAPAPTDEAVTAELAEIVRGAMTRDPAFVRTIAPIVAMALDSRR